MKRYLIAVVFLTLAAMNVGAQVISSTVGWHDVPGTALTTSNVGGVPLCAPDNFPANLGAYTSFASEPGSIQGSGHNFSASCFAIYNDSNGGAFDTLRNRMIIIGGGHNVSYDNSIFSFEVNQIGTANPVLARLTNPSDPSNCGSGVVCSSGTAIYSNPPCSPPIATFSPNCTPSHTVMASRHIYDAFVYVPATDSLLQYSGAPIPTGSPADPTMWALTASSVDYSCAQSPQPHFSANLGNVNGCGDPIWAAQSNSPFTGGVGFQSVVDPNTGIMWVVGLSGGSQGEIATYNPTASTITFTGGSLASHTWLQNSTSGHGGYHNTAIIDPYDKLFISIGSDAGPGGAPGIYYFSVANPAATGMSVGNGQIVNISPASCAGALSTGANPQGVQYPGLAWDPIDKSIVWWPNGYVGGVASPGTLYILHPVIGGAWYCTTETYGTSPANGDQPHVALNGEVITVNGATEGTFGRFQYSPTNDIFVLCGDYASDCFYLRRPRAGADFTNTTASTITNVPFSHATPIVQGEIPSSTGCLIPYFDNTGALTVTSGLFQTDVKNKWPDGSLKFAVASYIIPSIAAGQTVHARYLPTSSCNNTGFLTQAQMLSTSTPNYNFDAQIQLVNTGAGGTNATASARTMLTNASSCTAPTSDLDGFLSTNGNQCTYWLQGPVVTAVILEDRFGRTYDMQTDGGSGGTGKPLHPRFEAWFYPQNQQVLVGYTLENDWASSTAGNSARNQTYTSFTITGGNTTPTTEFTNYSTGWTQRTRTMFHQTWCITSGGTTLVTPMQNSCSATSLHVDHRWPYLAKTHFYPNWDPNLQISPKRIAYYAAVLSSTTTAGYTNPPINGTAGNGTMNWANCTNCFPQSAGGVFYYWYIMDTGGTNDNHGPLPTWDIVYLLTQCDTAVSTATTCGNTFNGDLFSTVLASADLGGNIPYWWREADPNAGYGGFFDASAAGVGTVGTLGRVVSINARTTLDTADANDTNPSNCNTGATFRTNDVVHFGGPAGQDIGGWANGSSPSGNNTDTSHWPNIAYTAYVTTGQYAYYEQQMMQSANAVGNAGGNSVYACPFTSFAQTTTGRQMAIGYIMPIDGDRSGSWAMREAMLGTFVALDGTPEKSYFQDKLFTNVAAWEGERSDLGLVCDLPTTGFTWQRYCPTTAPGDTTGTGNSYGWGFNIRGKGAAPSSAGSCVSSPVCTWSNWAGSPLGSFGLGLNPEGETINGGNYNSILPNCQYDGTSPFFQPTGCTHPYNANSHIFNTYSSLIVGWMDDLGLCPHTSTTGAFAGKCQLLAFVNNFFINSVMDPNSSPYIHGYYTYPTMSGDISFSTPNNTPIYQWGFGSSTPNAFGNFICVTGGTNCGWPPTSFTQTSAGNNYYGCTDEGWISMANANLSFAYSNPSSSEWNGSSWVPTGYSGSAAYNKYRALMLAFCNTTIYNFSATDNQVYGQASGSPKWDMVPRPSNTVPAAVSNSSITVISGTGIVKGTGVVLP